MVAHSHSPEELKGPQKLILLANKDQMMKSSRRISNSQVAIHMDDEAYHLHSHVQQLPCKIEDSQEEYED